MILLDTHVILWWLAGGDRLSARAAREIARADTLLVSPVSCWEITMLLSKGKVSLDRDPYQWVRDLLVQDRVQFAPLSAQASVGAAILTQDGFRGDPADSLLYCTARECVAPLVTKDAAIRAHARSAGDLRTIW